MCIKLSHKLIIQIAKHQVSQETLTYLVVCFVVYFLLFQTTDKSFRIILTRSHLFVAIIVVVTTFCVYIITYLRNVLLTSGLHDFICQSINFFQQNFESHVIICLTIMHYGLSVCKVCIINHLYLLSTTHTFV